MATIAEVEQTTAFALTEKSKVKIRYARDVRPNDLKQGNVILVGTAEATPCKLPGSGQLSQFRQLRGAIMVMQGMIHCVMRQ